MSADHRPAKPRDEREPWALRNAGVLIVLGILTTVCITIVGVFVAPGRGWFIPRDLTGKDQVGAQNQIRDIALKLAAGVAAGFAAFVTWGRIELARRQHANEVSAQVTDRYGKAIGQLGEADPSVRLGGLYALNRIARESPEDRATVYEVISAFVRYRTGTSVSPADRRSATDEDVRAAIRILVRRPWGQEEAPVDLAGANLLGAELTDARLGEAILSRAILCNAHLQDGDLRSAKLNRADLKEAKLQGADLGGADLRGADFNGCDLLTTDLREAQFDDATVWPDGFEPPRSARRHA